MKSIEQDSLQHVLGANSPDPAVKLVLMCVSMCVVVEKGNSLYVWRFLYKGDCLLHFQMSPLQKVFQEVNGGKEKEKTLLFSHEGEASILIQNDGCA